MKKEIYESYKTEDTFLLGQKLGERTKPGDIYCLNGDLGTGKTVFTKGFAHGMGISEPVSSPTFTIVQIYEDGRIPLYHYDVYRIEDISEMDEIGYEDYFYGKGVCLIEWADIIKELLPDNRVEILIEKDLSKGFDYRMITVSSENNIDLQ